VEFGSGFDVSSMLGSQANDEFYYDENKKVKTYSNNNGGINGGLANGMPITLRVAFKPVPSISKEQRTINIETGENTTIKISGRHDSCFVPRAVPAVEAMVALSLVNVIK
jgi:chorismate synthase